jgi:calcineurin-like phosphoesterase family protein
LTAAVFVHLSDIHFGQEKGESVHIHDDVKEQLIADAQVVVSNLSGKVAHGILVTGDVAHSGKKNEYDVAGSWLDRLAGAVGCETFRIQLIPGNHDVDRDMVSSSAKHILDDIRTGGSDVYEAILGNEIDRTALFARFRDYAKFCEGYDCPLDAHGRYSTNLRVELAPGRSLRFIRMNSSLLCTGEENDTEPELLLGARQFTIPRAEGEEVVVLVHHPLHWLKDSRDVATYFESRARVVISGHEHDPRASVKTAEPGSDVLMLAAGATVPFKSDGAFTYCYNVIEFEWDASANALVVVVHARAWNPMQTRFEADVLRLGGASPRFVLGCPNYRRMAAPLKSEQSSDTPPINVSPEPSLEMVPALDGQGVGTVPPEVEGYRSLLLRFFRDLTEGERLRVLLDLGAIDADDDQSITQSVERKLFDWLIDQGRIEEVERLMKILQSANSGDRL